MQHKILCFGDSNTWGFDAETYQAQNKITRFKTAWPQVLQASLGNHFNIIVDALNGRTTNLEHDNLLGRNGHKDLPLTLEKHAPLDIVILALGVNDLKAQYNPTPEAVYQGICGLIDLIKNSKHGDYGQEKIPHILIISPPKLTREDAFNHEFKGAIEKSLKLFNLYNQLSDTFIHVVDANEFGLTLATDGLHLTENDHEIFGDKISSIVRDIFTF